MKITRNTPEQLIIANQPWLIGIMMVVFILAFVGTGLFLIAENLWAGLLFILVGGGAGLGAFAGFVRRVQLILDRPSQTVTMRTRSVLGYSEVRYELPHLSHAVLETSSTSKGGPVYRPTLILDAGMSAGAIPIVEIYTNTSGPERVVEAINAWLGATPA